MASQRMPDTRTMLSTAASVAASAMLIRSVVVDFLPEEIGNHFFSMFRHLSQRFSSQFTIVIDEFQGNYRNQVFEAVHTYLGSKVTPSTRRVRLGKTEKDKKLAIAMDRNEEMVDRFEGIQVKWKLICTQVNSVVNHHRLRDLGASIRSEARAYELSFHKKHKEKVINSYFPYIMERSSVITQESKAIKLHVFNDRDYDMEAVNLDHPMTFKSLAMDFELKKALVDDLDNFTKGKEFYSRIGKAWKRGYLLYGPPGTGKSSLIAAMANYLNYDIYDLDLSSIRGNSELRYSLLRMSSRSILVIEDIDCTIKLKNREAEDEQGDNDKVTLSGLLNLIDGLWSCCRDEHIIIFTTNHKERLDPALLRPGRMDVHIEMSYCTFCAFKQLALNYFGVLEHKLFVEIEKVIAEAKVTPAQVAGELMKSSDVEVSLNCLLEFLHKKI